MANNQLRLTTSSLHTRITLMFLLVAIGIGMLIFVFWTKILEPRLRDDAKSNATSLAYIQTQVLADSFNPATNKIDFDRVNRTIDRILLLTDSNTERPLVTGLELELDPDVILIPKNSLKTKHGETSCGNCFIMENPLYSSIDQELIGITRLYISDIFFQRLKNDVRNYFILGFGVLIALISISWFIVAFLLRPLTELASLLHQWNTHNLDHIPQLHGIVSEEIVLVKSALDNLLTEIHQQILVITHAQEYTDSIINSMQEALFVVNNNMTIRSANQYSNNMLGYKKAELAGKPFSEVIQTTKDKLPEALLKETEFTGSEIQLLSKTGELISVLLSRSHLQSQEETSNVSVFIATDITQRKKAELAIVQLNEELEQKVEERTAELRAAQQSVIRKERLATVGQVTATVSHELRNPLGTIRTSVHTLAKKLPNTDPKIKNIFSRIERNVGRCDNIIGELLEFTRVKELQLTTIVINVWLQKVINEYTAPSGIVIKSEITLTDNDNIEVDTERFRRVIFNVLDNAVQAFPLSEDLTKQKLDMIITVKTQKLNDWIIISCIDNGSGMSTAIMKDIFEPLFSTKGFGVGLGLPMVQNIMLQHQGEVLVNSQEGKGTQVDLKLPRPKK